MPTKTKPAEQAEATRTCLGVECPLRSTAENASFGYCEGCPKTRPCPSCGQRKPQAGWWWGSAWNRVDHWTCEDCRYDLAESWADMPADPERRARVLDWLSSHPELAAIVEAHPTFVASLDLAGDEQRFETASALSRAAQVSGSDVLARMAAALRSSAGGGRISVDVSDVDMLARNRVTVALYNVAQTSTHTPEAARAPLAALLRVWDGWLDGHVQTAPRKSQSAAEARKAERSHLLRVLDGEG
jgi:hypothetical protein